MFIASAALKSVLSPNAISKIPLRIFTAVRNNSYNKARNKKLYDILKTMPKKVDVKELQSIRLARRTKIRKYPPSTVYLQVLGSGAPGAPNALYVFTEQARFLFNCGEGSQRLAYEHKVKLGMMEHILITHKSWNNVGGLPGVLLTLQDTGVPEITLHGPSGIESLYDDTRHFIRFRDLDINYKHFSDNDGICGDGNDPLTIQSIPIWKKEASPDAKSDDKNSIDDNQEEVEGLYAHEKTWFKKKPRHESNQFVTPEVRRQKLEESKKCRNLAIAYICRPPPKAGALLLAKCVKAGVPPGPLLGDLKRGQDVTLPNGKVVLAGNVTAVDDPGPVFMVVEAPTVEYLDSLLESPAFAKYQASATCDGDLTEVVVHFTPSNVMSDPRYQEWMSRFSPSTNHLCLNDSSSCMGSEAVHRVQYKLNLLSEHLFPLLKDQSIPMKEQCDPDGKDSDDKDRLNGNTVRTDNSPNSEDAHTKNSADTSVNSSFVIGPVHQATTLMTYHIRPRKKLDRSSDLKLTPKTYLEECYAMPNFETALADAKSKMCTSENKGENAESYPNITFLGTGSCIPNKTRNTSGILINMSANKTLLMDCGEGTYGQLVRFLGVSGSDETLRQLAAVYVSHLHADHHIGFIRLLLARRRAFKLAGVENVPKLLLLAPSKIMTYLSSYDMNFESILQDFNMIGNQNFLSSHFKSKSEMYADICSQMDMESIDMTYVIHCPNSFGVACTHKDGWKLAYSGDTMPCENFVRIGQNCDLLIHEATMEDELEEDARLKTHSTTSQAIKVGCDMNARHILLTHFSQRYAKVPLLQGDVPENVGIAFDNMKVCLQNLPTLHHMYGALVTMFAEDYDDMLEKTAKKRAARENLKMQVDEIISKNNEMESLMKRQKKDTL